VLAVIATHFNAPGIVNGGLVGVTLFFVLSGYLITTLLVTERESVGRIDLASFYVRRAARLLPALALVLVAVGTALIIDGRPGVALAGVVTSSLYVSNLAVAGGVVLGPLEHTWSLAIEEQFYLLWPAILIIGIARRRLLIPLLVVGIAVSAALRLGPITDIERFWWLYHHTFTRADALLVGCLLALVPFRPSPPTTLLAAASLVLLVVLPTDQGTFATLLLLPTAIAGGIVVVSKPRWLGIGPLVAVGRISYGLYLWHFPLAELLPAWAAFIGTFVMAMLSYRFVELPIRRAAAKWHTRARSLPTRDRGVALDRAAVARGAAVVKRPAVADDRGAIRGPVVAIRSAVVKRPAVADDRGAIRGPVVENAVSPAVPPTIAHRDIDPA
jgi:peptidoglycan/LPS O-acetylase OafA/YrhL